jgi:hypothetical protein
MPNIIGVPRVVFGVSPNRVFRPGRRKLHIGTRALPRRFGTANISENPMRTVLIRPTSASASMLEPGISKRAFIPMAFGLGFAIFGGWFALSVGFSGDE